MENVHVEIFNRTSPVVVDVVCNGEIWGGGEGKQGLGESKKKLTARCFLGEHHLLIGLSFLWGLYTFLKMLKKQSVSRLTNLPLVAFCSPQRDQALSEYAYKSFLLSPQ